MSKATAFVYLAAAAVVLFGGTALGRNFGLSQFASVGVGLVPALLLAYPLARRASGSRLGFATWLLVVACMTAAATLINTLVA